MSINKLEQCLKIDYQITGQLSPLYSYQDRGYLLCTDMHTSDSKPVRYVVKVMNPEADPKVVDMQVHLLRTLREAQGQMPGMPGIAEVLLTHDGRTRSVITGTNGEHHIVWVVGFLEGILAADQQPYTPPTLHNLGTAIACIHKALESVDHDGLHTASEWNLMEAEWIAAHVPALRATFGEHADWLENVITEFQDPDPKGFGSTAVRQLSAQAIHGDINAHNVVLSAPTRMITNEPQSIAGIIDFGDAHCAPRVCDLAIAATYFMMHQKNPWMALAALVRGYHSITSLTRRERELIMPLVRMRLAQSLTQSMRHAGKSPDDDYVTISQRPALALISQLKEFRNGFASYWIHHACGDQFLNDKRRRLVTALEQAPAAAVVDANLRNATVLDLSPGSGQPADPFGGDMPDPLEATSEENRAVLGRYGEPRLVYQAAEFRSTTHPASPRSEPEPPRCSSASRNRG